MIEIKPCKLKGTVTVPPSKSITHRAVIASALSKGISRIKNVELSNDVKATIECANALGAVCVYEDSTLMVDGTKTLETRADAVLNCGESGSTIRFMIPVALLRGGKISFTGSQRLLERPLGTYEKFFGRYRKNEADSSISFCESAAVLSGGLYELDGGVSSQFVTGLLLALPCLEGDSNIAMTSPLESKPYVDLTISVINNFGIEITNNNYESFFIKGGQRYTPCDFTIEGDYSQAAFWLAANALGSDIICNGLNPKSLQGDKVISDIILKGILPEIISVSEIPDLVPILAVLFSLKQGERRIVDAGRLRFKESDRLHAITLELNKLGADITENSDSLIIKGVKGLRGGKVDAHNDHRIAMALAIAATRADNPVIIHGEGCVSKSYPKFFDEYNRMMIV